MKHPNTLLLFSSLVLAMLTQPASAQTLCSTSCELNINFTDGGSIEAVEALTITFGEGGFINDGVVTTGFAKDENVQLNAGESLVFSAGAEFNLGSAGNIDYSAMNLNASDIIISAPSAGIVSVHGDSSFTVGNTFELNSDLSLSAELDLSVSATATPSSGATLMSGTGSITVQPGTTGAIILANNQVISSSTATVSLVEINQIQTSNVVIIDPIVISPIETPIVIPPLEITPLTQESLVDMEGFTMSTEDGSDCTIQNGVCIDSQGITYVLVAGKFVQQQSRVSGGFNLPGLLFLFSLLVFYRFRRVH